RFPLEARVNPMFQEMEDADAKRLQQDVLETLAGGEHRGAIQALLDSYSGGDVPDLLSRVVSHQIALGESKSWEDIAKICQLEPDLDENRIEGRLFLGSEGELVRRVADAMHGITKSDSAIAEKLRAVPSFDLAGLPALKAALFTGSGTPVKRLEADKVIAAVGPDCAALMQLVHRIAAAQEEINALNAARRTGVLLDFSVPFLAEYARAKQVRGLLDFDDLILRTRMLLRDPMVAAWVLYRLDGGISHMLVDEAQDTSPAQWDVIRQLTAEFTAGQGAQEDKARSLFVVGDKKQSIYSFQGADPDEFDRMEAAFADKFRAIEAPFVSRSLEYSFRSSDAILQLVDETFRDQPSAGFVTDQKHRAFHGDKPGRVDLWPVVPPVKAEDDGDWFDPVDRLPEEHHTVTLARNVADHIQQMLNKDAPAMIPEKSGDGYVLRPVQPGDVMILVQRRSDLFHEIIRACKARDLPIAGADRLRVGAELAVRDLLALLSFLSLPEDSLSLATVLRSPLFGWSEKELYDLAQGRSEKHLWAALRKQEDSHPKTHGVLKDLRNQVDFLRPYDLLERILTRHQGRERLIARLGPEAEDGIDALLSQALNYERSNIPSLTGFLVWANADDLEIKRQADGAGNLIRVMTVHGAKGLEAPIVILPDCGLRKLDIRDEILPSADGAMWRVSTAERPEAMRAVIDDMKAAVQRERLRLLYVAMTRAETWLIVGAAGDLAKDGTSWHSLVEEGMQRIGAIPAIYPGGAGLRYEFGNWALAQADTQASNIEQSALLEPIFSQQLAEAPKRYEPLKPSDLGGAKALGSDAGLDEETAKLRGTYLHHLLEALIGTAQSDWSEIISRITVPDLLDMDLVTSVQADVQRVLGTPDLAWVFTQEGQSEVPVAGSISGKPIYGLIDRLVPQGDTLHIIDFKSNATVPDNAEACPEGILRQMGAYAAMAAAICSDKEISCGILWTSAARYMSLPHNMVMEALGRSPNLDVAGSGS
ncbi:MAG: double-strand break repair helicase AddA, partial [Pseudomonadota bacterium]